MRLRDESTYTDHGVERGSKDIKNPKDKDIEMLKDHLNRQKVSFGDQSFREHVQRRRGSQIGAESSVPKKQKDEAGRAALKVDVEREAPKLHGIMQKDFKRVGAEIDKAEAKAKQAIAEVAKLELPAFQSDAALKRFADSVAFRYQLVLRWKGDGQTVVLVKPKDAPTASAPAAPTTPIAPAGGVPPTPSPTKSQSNFIGDASACENFEKKVRGQTTKELLDEQPARRPFTGESDIFLAHAELTDLMVEMLSLESDGARRYQAIKSSWEKAIHAVSQMADGTHKSSSDLMGHLSTKERELKRAAVREANAREKEMLDQVKRDAKEQADQIRAKRSTPKEIVIKPIYGIDLPEEKVPKMCELKAGDVPDYLLPFKCEASEKLHLWVAGPAVQKALNSFGGQYKKSDDFTEKGRSQHPLLSKFGREETAEYMAEILPEVLDIKKIVGGESFMSQYWLYGLDADSRLCSSPPNGAHMVKVLVAGTQHWLLIELVSLAAYGRTLVPEKRDRLLNIETIYDEIEAWDEAALSAALAGGVRIVQTTQVAKETVHVPQGWVCVERIDKNQKLVYGMRKTVLTKSAAAIEAYRVWLSIYMAAGRNMARMDAIRVLMEASAPAAVPGNPETPRVVASSVVPS